MTRAFRELLPTFWRLNQLIDDGVVVRRGSVMVFQCLLKSEVCVIGMNGVQHDEIHGNLADPVLAKDSCLPLILS